MANSRLDYEGYIAVRAEGQEAAGDQTKFMDQANLTLAGGALGLALTFLHDLGKPADATCLLLAGGIFLIASIMLTLGSVHMSQKAINQYINDLDRAANANFSEASTQFLFNNYVNAGARITFWMNIIASIALVAGLVFVSTFGYINIAKNSGANQMQKTVSSGHLQKGLVPMTPAIARPTPQPAPAPSQPVQSAPKK